MLTLWYDPPCFDVLIQIALDKGWWFPQSLRGKAREDLVFRERLLNYIESVCCQCMPDEIVDDSPAELESLAFQPMLPPDHPNFQEAMDCDVFDIVSDRQIHSDHHNPTCFKYGKGQEMSVPLPTNVGSSLDLRRGYWSHTSATGS
jgi:hypothetical protein